MQRTVRVGIIDSGFDPHLARDVQLDKAVDPCRGADGRIHTSPCDTDSLGCGTPVALAVSLVYAIAAAAVVLSLAVSPGAVALAA